VKGVTGYFQAVLGGVTGEQLIVTVDGERVAQFDWDKEISGTTGLGKSTPKIPVTAGLHTLGVTFLATNDVPGSELNRPFQRTMNTPGSIPGFLVLSARRPGADRRALRHQRRRRHGRRAAPVLSCRPKTPAQEPACARSIVSSLARKAFRRPITAADLAS
jgi:hypothetical protein